MAADDDGATQSGLAALLRALFRDAETLVVQQLALLRAETGESLRDMGTGTLLAIAGVGLALIGGIAVVAALVVLLAAVMPLWLACALVGVVFVLAGGALVWWGRRLVTSASLVPRRTLESLAETAAWAHEELT